MSLPPSRPLSPHIQIYRWQWTSLLSITHRFTGIALCGGIFAFVAWLYALSAGAEEYGHFQSFFESWYSQVFIGGVIFSLNYHWANGIRHLIWDWGYGFSLSTSYASGMAVIAFSIVMTLLMLFGWR